GREEAQAGDSRRAVQADRYHISHQGGVASSAPQVRGVPLREHELDARPSQLPRLARLHSRDHHRQRTRSAQDSAGGTEEDRQGALEGLRVQAGKLPPGEEAWHRVRLHLARLPLWTQLLVYGWQVQGRTRSTTVSKSSSYRVGEYCNGILATGGTQARGR
ncbi:MAG: hypothetical protein P4L69_03125, partial [Desulfosporosinus sp.]|nr:hypothetical protein [Desulfosporosinus sp.]